MLILRTYGCNDFVKVWLDSYGLNLTDFPMACHLYSDGTPGAPNKWRDLKNAKAIAYTCYQMYAKMETGISAEYVRFQGPNDLVAAPQVC